MLVTLGAVLYSVCGVLRLVRFNVSAPKEEPDKKALLKRRNFIGLPIPGGAAAVVSANLFMLSPSFQQRFDLPGDTRAFLMALLMAFVGYLMVCHLRYPSVKSLQVKVSNFGWIFALTVLAVLIFWGIVHHFALLFVTVTWLYVLSGGALSAWRKIRKNRRA
jgi:CDP-diacylglycerol--serine O-phosphatidyltransferase